LLNACALCSLEIPKIHSKIDLQITDKNLHKINFGWVFSESFTKQLLDSYDENGNNKFDLLEIKEIQKILVTYIKPKNFLINAVFYDENKTNKLNLKMKNYKLGYKNGRIIFNFQANCSLKLKENRTIKILLEDDKGFFDFRILQAKQIILDNSLFLIPNINGKVAFYKVSQEPMFQKAKTSNTLPKVTIKQKVETKSYYDLLKSTLTTYTKKIKISLQSIQKENSLQKMLILLGFSFLYGFFHALGPGHGKTLVSSYFLANGGTWYKALIFSLRIGVIHVLSAFVLVIVSMYIIKTFVSKVLIDISVYTSYISGVVIITIALFMLYKKYSTQKHSHTHSCSCHACSSTKKDWGIAIAAGIVPCAGTVVIFILTFTLGNYLIGFLSAIAMAIGMGSVIFVSSIFAQYLNANLTNKYKNILSLIEYFAIVFILILGILLVVSPLKI
jgi:ABC-type nickel/cobalt efflux system permease component RcnA